MSLLTAKPKQKRLEWVDIAKEIAILLMVIGHEVKNMHIYALIFSFHMPLFFILSGYTSSRVNNWNKFIHKQKKSFKRIWLLAVLMVFLLGLENLALLSNFTLQEFGPSLIKGIYWGSNVPVLGVMSVGVMWFMFVFFWSKFLFDLLQVLLPDIYSGLILFVLSGLSMIWCQNFAHFLPQALDIVPIAALFMWIGTFIKESVDFDNLTGLNKLVFTGLIIIWAGCFICKIYIELSTRHYPGLYLPIFEAVGETFVVAFLLNCSHQGKYQSSFKPLGKFCVFIIWTYIGSFGEIISNLGQLL